MPDIGTNTLDLKLIMRGTTTQKNAYTNPEPGTLFYDETLNSVWEWNGSTWQAYGPMTPGGGGTGALAAQVQGNVAHDSPDVGNPVKTGGIAKSAVSAVAATTGDRVDTGYDVYSRQFVAIGAVNGTAGADSMTAVFLPFVAGTQDINSSRPLTVAQSLFNGTSWDRLRGNVDASLLASAARTATTNTPDQTNHNGKGVALTINVTVEGAATLSMRLQGKDSVSGNYYDITADVVVYTAAADTPPITRTIFCYPGVLNADFIGVGATVNGSVGKAVSLPRVWRAVITPADATTTTYSVAGTTLL